MNVLPYPTDRGGRSSTEHDGTMATAFFDELEWRGQLHQRTAGAELDEHLNSGMRLAYAGFDPTSDSLTIGNFIPAKMLMHWQQCSW